MMPMLTIVGNLAPLSIGVVVQRGASLQGMLASIVTVAYAISAFFMWMAARDLWDEKITHIARDG
jgi:hypothetical protein